MGTTRYVRAIGVIAGTAAAALLPQLLAAQTREATTSTSTRTSTTILRVTTAGSPTGARTITEPVRATSPLTSLQLGQLASSLGLNLIPSEGVTVSTNELQAAGGRVKLKFDHPVSVSYGGAVLDGQSVVQLSVRAVMAGEQYLVDCTVSELATYEMSGAGTSADFSGTSHLLAHYTAANTNQTFFEIKRLSGNGVFYSCQVAKVY